jgi:DNA repair protein RadA/Sms
VFLCRICQFKSELWTNRCPACGRFNALASSQGSIIVKSTSPDVPPIARQVTGVGVFDDVMLGGLVLGSSVIIGGIAGAGKSTMVLQVAGGLARAGMRVAYVCAEEDPTAVITTGRRVGAIHENLDLVRTTDGGEALMLAASYDVAIYDSIQKLHLLAGDIATPRTRILVSQLNKMGEIVGERSNEHDPDTLLTADYFPGEDKRILVSTKNRHGILKEAPYDLTDVGAVGRPCKDCNKCFVPCACPPRKPKKKKEAEQPS